VNLKCPNPSLSAIDSKAHPGHNQFLRLSVSSPELGPGTMPKHEAQQKLADQTSALRTSREGKVWVGFFHLYVTDPLWLAGQSS